MTSKAAPGQLLTESLEMPARRAERCTARAVPVAAHAGIQSSLYQLQRAVGNRRVLQLIQSKRLSGDGRIYALHRGFAPEAAGGLHDSNFETALLPSSRAGSSGELRMGSAAELNGAGLSAQASPEIGEDTLRFSAEGFSPALSSRPSRLRGMSDSTAGVDKPAMHARANEDAENPNEQSESDPSSALFPLASAAPSTPEGLATNRAPGFAVPSGAIELPAVAGPTELDGEPPPGEASPIAAVESLSGPASFAQQGEGGEREAPATEERGPASAPASSESSVAAAAAQIRRIEADSLQSEAQVTKMASAHRAQIGGQFGGVRRTLSGFFTQASAAIRGFIAGKQAEVAAASVGALKSVETIVSGGREAAWAQGTRIRESIDGIVETLSSSVRSRVNGAVGQIVGLIDGVRLPDLPGVAQARAVAVGVLRRAAGAVTSGLDQVLRLLGSALNAGIGLIGSFLSTFAELAQSALSQAASTIRRISQAVAQGLSLIIATIASMMQRALNAILPAIDRIERSIVQAISKGQQQTLEAIRTNRRQHVLALAPAAASAAGGGAAGAQTVSTVDGASRIEEVGEEAIRNNRTIVQSFDERVASTFASIYQVVVGAVAQIGQRISAAVSQVVALVAGKVAGAMASLVRIGQAVVSFVQSLVQALTGALPRIVEYVQSLVQNPVDQLIGFAQGAYDRLKRFIADFVRKLISGSTGTPSTASGDVSAFVPRSGPIIKPIPGPILKPVLQGLLLVFVAAAAIVAFFFPALAAAVIAALMAYGLTELAAVIVLGILAIIVLLLLLLLLYLLFRWLLKIRPPPKPKRTKITSKTVAKSPGARTRTNVGVGEEVDLTYSGGSTTWATTGGTLDSTTGSSVRLTAPDTAGAATVTGGTAAITFAVIAPSGVHMDRKSGKKHTKDHADYGILTQPFILPDNVNFYNVIYQEVDVGAVVSTPGAFDCFPGHDHCGKGGSGGCGDLLLTNKVVGGKGTKAVEADCVYSGDCLKTPPFSPGTLSFSIPYEYKVGASGTYRRFSTVVHLSALAADAVTLSADKAGAHGDIRVSDGSGTIPGC